jgi:hypothetical protein
MDTIDNFDSSEDLAPGNEAVSNTTPEQREKQREKSSKALAGIRASRKDESKARKQDDLFAKLLSQFLRKNEDPSVLDKTLKLLDCSIPTHFLVVCFSLWFPWALVVVRESLHIAQKWKDLIFVPNRGDFKDSELNEEEKAYLHSWIDISFQLLTENPSEVMTLKLLNQLENENRVFLEEGLQFFFIFYLKNIGFTPTANSTLPFTKYLIAQIEKRLRGLEFSDSIFSY